MKINPEPNRDFECRVPHVSILRPGIAGTSASHGSVLVSRHGDWNLVPSLWTGVRGGSRSLTRLTFIDVMTTGLRAPRTAGSPLRSDGQFVYPHRPSISTGWQSARVPAVGKLQPYIQPVRLIEYSVLQPVKKRRLNLDPSGRYCLHHLSHMQDEFGRTIFIASSRMDSNGQSAQKISSMKRSENNDHHKAGRKRNRRT
jgi:hypothetical protein